MITMTTSSSRSVKPRAPGFRLRAGSYIVYIVGAAVRARGRMKGGLVSPMVVEDGCARQWAGALENGGETRTGGWVITLDHLRSPATALAVRRSVTARCAPLASLCFVRVVRFGRVSAVVLLSEELSVHAQHGRDVVTGLREGRNAPAVALHRLLARVVRREGELEIVAESPQHVAQVMRAGGDVLLRVEGVGYPVAARGGGLQLHQPLRPPLGHGTRVERGFHQDDRPHQLGAQRGRSRRPLDHGIVVGRPGEVLSGRVWALRDGRRQQQPVAAVNRDVAEMRDARGVHETVDVRPRSPPGRGREQYHGQPEALWCVHWLCFTLRPKDITGRVSGYLRISVNHAPSTQVDPH